MMGLHEGALADYDRALEKVTDRWEWWAGRAGVAAALKRWERAALDYAQAAKLLPRGGELWRKLGLVEAERGQWKQAADALAKAIRFGVEEPAAWYEQTLAQLSAGDVKGYRATCARMVRKFAGRDDAAMRQMVADACVLGPEAVADLKKLVERAKRTVADFPALAGERLRLAALLLRSGDAAGAVAVLEKLVAGEQAGPRELWLAVLAYQAAGQKDKATEALARAQAAKEPAGATWQERQTGALWRREAEATR
jgi:tetratricopeptide (TPR) repeat protein